MALLLVGVAALALTIVALAIAIARARRRPRKRRSRKWLSAGGLVIDAGGRIALVRQRNRRGRWHWTLPKGRIDGRNWAVGDIGGVPGQSLKVCLVGENRGLWLDFADEGWRGDVVYALEIRRIDGATPSL